MTVSYRLAEQRDIQEILRISSHQFGSTYLTKGELLELLQSPNTMIPILWVNGTLAGYSILHLFKRKELAQVFRAEDIKYFEKFRAEDIFQVRKSTALSAEYTGKGLGRNFIEWSMKEFGKESDHILSINWKRGDHIPMRKISEGLGMKELCELEGYWESDSLKKGYVCPRCGQPPCKCSAVVFIKSV